MDDGLRIRVEHDGQDPIVHLAGEIDLATAPLLRESLAGLDGRVTVDLAEVTLLESRGIGVLARQKNRLAQAGGTLFLRSPQDQVRRTLETVGLGEWIE